MAVISIVVPCFNEQETLGELYARICDQAEASHHAHELILVDDGSRDGTAEIIAALAANDSRVHGVSLSRNFGHEAAIEAGLRETTGDAAIVMDADLQDSPEALPAMVAAWENGADVAYAVRRNRKENVIMRSAFTGFYRLAGRIVSIDLPADAGPFSLVSRPVIDVLNAMPEYNRYFPGLRAFAGFEQVAIEVDRGERHAGETKYSFSRRASGAVNAITAFSKLPLRAVTVLGLVSAAFAVLAGLLIVGLTIGGADAVPGWASIMVVMLMLAGVQLLTLGIVGEYVGKVYDEVRRRPTFVVRQRYGSSEMPPLRAERARDDDGL